MANTRFVSKEQIVNTTTSNCSEMSPGRKKTKSNISFTTIIRLWNRNSQSGFMKNNLQFDNSISSH